MRFYPRAGSPDRMTGGKFQGSADGVTYTDLDTIAATPADGQWTTATLSADPKTFRYLRYLSPIGSYGNIAELEFYSGASTAKLTGTPFGTPGSYANSGSDFTKVFDGSTATFFDSPQRSGSVVGFDQGAPSPPPALPSLTPVYQINAGGARAGSFAADGYVQGGSTWAISTPIDTSGAPTAAPQAVYQSERYGSFTYTLPGLTPGAGYTLRLHFAEITWTDAGHRLFNVAVNGQPMLSNFDVLATAGGPKKAIEETCQTTADSSGKVSVAFTTVKDNAKLSGLELLH